MDNFWQWFQDNWANILIILVAIHTCLKAIRDAIDSTPESDDNWFERLVTFIGKIVAYLGGKRSIPVK